METIARTRYFPQAQDTQESMAPAQCASCGQPLRLHCAPAATRSRWVPGRSPRLDPGADDGLFCAACIAWSRAIDDAYDDLGVVD